MRPVSQAADKADSILVSVARPCWPSQGRGRSGGPRKRIFIPPHPHPCHSPRGAGCVPPSRPLPRIGGARATVPCLGSLCLPGDGWQARGRRLPWQPCRPQGNSGGPHTGGRGARHASPAPSPALGAVASGPGFRGFVERLGGGGNWVHPALLLGWGLILDPGVLALGGASTGEGSGPAPGAR